MGNNKQVLSVEQLMELKSFKILDEKSKEILKKGYDKATEKTKKKLVEQLLASNDRLISYENESESGKRIALFKGYLGAAISTYKRKVNAVKKDINKRIEDKEQRALEKSLEESLKNYN